MLEQTIIFILILALIISFIGALIFHPMVILIGVFACVIGSLIYLLWAMAGVISDDI